MNGFFEIFSDHTFATVALGSAALGGISGVVGSFAVLRRQGLLGDGVSHSALLGVAAAFLVTGIKSTAVLLLGALISGLLAVLLISAAVKGSRIKFDAALAVVMSTFFGLGTVLLTCAQKLPDATQAGLSAFIYGQASAMLKSDVFLILGCSAVLLLVVVLLWKELKLFSFDRDFAVQSGYSDRALSFVLSLMTVAAVILGIQTVGVVLMSAMLVTPAAAARQWSDRLWIMASLAAAFGGASGAAGAYASAAIGGLPTGPAIVIAASVIALISILFAPRRGIVSRIVKRRRSRIILTQERPTERNERI
ncbi:MAG: metal ABC transporter permease [Bacteroides sp.]|nr:metal ABC transporter permease [Bacteroides sp.]